MEFFFSLLGSVFSKLVPALDIPIFGGVSLWGFIIISAILGIGITIWRKATLHDK